MKKYSITFIVLICIIFGIYMRLQKPNTSIDSKQQILRVGIAAGYAPWISINEQGQYEGFDIDVIEEIAKLLDKKLILNDLGSMTSLLIALEQGAIDAIIWGMSITQDRQNKFAMIHYQGEKVTTYPLIFWQEIPKDVTTLQDLAGKIVCIEPASSQSIVLGKYPQIIPLETDSIDNALLNIQYKKAAAALVEPVIAKKFQTKFPEIKILNVPLDTQDLVEGVGIITQQKQTDLINQLTYATTILKENGFILNAEIKWGMR